jgi:hypothetical protein
LQVLFMSPEFRKGIYDIDPHSLGLESVCALTVCFVLLVFFVYQVLPFCGV